MCMVNYTIQKRYVWTQIFLNTDEKISVFQNIRLRVDEALEINDFTAFSLAKKNYARVTSIQKITTRSTFGLSAEYLENDRLLSYV